MANWHSTLYVLSAFVLYGLTIGPQKLLGIFFIHLQYEFGASAKVVSMALGMSSSLTFFYGPVAAALYSRFGARAVLLGGTALASLGIVTISFAHNIVAITVVNGIITGSISALPLTVLSDLFGTEELPFALGFRSLLSGIGMTVYPIFVGALIDATNSYRPAHYVAAACGFLSSLLVWIAELGQRAQQRTT